MMREKNYPSFPKQTGDANQSHGKSPMAKAKTVARIKQQAGSEDMDRRPNITMERAQSLTIIKTSMGLVEVRCAHRQAASGISCSKPHTIDNDQVDGHDTDPPSFLIS